MKLKILGITVFAILCGGFLYGCWVEFWSVRVPI